MTRAEGDRVEVARAKGRPKLSWVGKRPLREVEALLSTLVERFAPETPDGIVAGDVDWADWPERFGRSDVVGGTYDLEAPTGDRPAAVRVTDMLGEEILIVEDRRAG